MKPKDRTFLAKAEQKFWSNVDKRQGDSGCWLWTKAIDDQGRGRLRFKTGEQDKAKTWHAHRVSWFLTYHEDPSPLVIMHTCDNRACVNPSHLRLGTQKDNMNDRNIKGRVRWKGYKSEKVEMVEIQIGEVKMTMAAYWNHFSLKTRKELEDKLAIPASYEVAVQKQKG